MGTNYFGLAAKQNLKTRPQDFILDEDEIANTINKKIKEIHALHKKNDEAKPKPSPSREFDQLQRTLFKLKQIAEGRENNLNNAAGTVSNLEDRIKEATAKQLKANKAGNKAAERTYRQQAGHLQDELADAKQRHKIAEVENKRAVAALNAFDGYARIEELKKEMELKENKDK